MTLTNLLLRGVKSQFNADANRKTLELPVNVALPFTQLSSCISLPGKCGVKSSWRTQNLADFPDRRRGNVPSESAWPELFTVYYPTSICGDDTSALSVQYTVKQMESLQLVLAKNHPLRQGEFPCAIYCRDGFIRKRLYPYIL